MSKTYSNTDPQAGDSEQVLLEKIVQKKGGSLKWGESIRSLLRRILELVSPAKVYFAMLTQTSTGAPVPTVLENTLDAGISFTRSNEGEYGITSPAGAFSTNKTQVLFGAPRKLADPAVISCALANPTTVTFSVKDSATQAGADDRLRATAIRIYVYP